MPRSQFIAAHFEHLIKTGVIKSGEKMPSFRKVGYEHNVCLSIVQQSYNLLENKKMIVSRGRAGYYVVRAAALNHLPIKTHPLSQPVEIAHSDRFNALHNLYFFKNILPTTHERSYLPQNIHNQLSKRISNALKFGIPDIHQDESVLGLKELRQQVSIMMNNNGLTISADKIVITSGYHNALYMTLLALCSPGDTIAVESPTTWRTLLILRLMKLKVVEVATCSEEGLCLSSLEAVLKKWPVKALLVTPNSNNPMGFIMPDASKQQLIKLADAFSCRIIEDDTYSDLIGTISRPRTIKSFDTHDRVILCGSLSRTVSSELKIGWVIAGELQSRISEMKLATIGTTSPLMQLAAANLIESGSYHRHVQKTIKLCQHSQVQYIRAIEQYFPMEARTTSPMGNGYLWVVLPEKIDIDQIIHSEMALNINFLSGIVFSASGRYHNCMRIDCLNPLTTHTTEMLKKIGKEIAARL
ncbi:PLP-dependent aminotransferase family protein [Kluyvera sp. STS39-E]|uniref:PLP-dependent aminotransferase family protein n=1 Tax=Kluyvera sp. STS39-E TaxID=3234748 RepID=UPI0034C670F7